MSVSAVQSRSAPPSAPPMRSQASRQSVRRPQRAGSEALGLRGGRGWYRDEPAEAKLSEESVRDDPAPTEAPVMDEASSAAALAKSAIQLRALLSPRPSEPPLRAGAPRWASAVAGTRAPALRPRDGWAGGGPLGRRGPAAEWARGTALPPSRAPSRAVASSCMQGGGPRGKAIPPSRAPSLCDERRRNGRG